MKIPRLTMQCRTTLDPVTTTTAKLLPPLEQDPVQDTLTTHMYRAWGENIKCTCQKYGIRTHFKGNRTIKQILVKPRDKDPEEKKSGVIYCYQWPAIDCGEEYIGETSRTLGERYQEHLQGPSPIQEHIQLVGHQTTQYNFSIIGREGQDFTRMIKESIFIRVNNPTLKGM